MSVLSKASGLALESGSAVPAVGCRHFGVCHFWRGEGYGGGEGTKPKNFFFFKIPKTPQLATTTTIYPNVPES
jgi:hypothetical protein